MIQQAYKICKLAFVAFFNVFPAEDHLHIEIKWVGTGKEWVPMETKCFIAVGVFSVELFAYQISMVSTANSLR